jgi:hypothetical protein
VHSGAVQMLAVVATCLLAAGDLESREAVPNDQSASETLLAVVEVEASRLTLERRVSDFVSSITRHVDDESPAVWHRSVCPLVAGLKPPQGEAVLARISEIAVASGVALGTERCRPNLYVVAADDPSALISAWRKRSPGMFNGATPVAVERFASTPRSIRAWYQVGRIGAHGVPLRSLGGRAERVADLQGGV